MIPDHSQSLAEADWPAGFFPLPQETPFQLTLSPLFSDGSGTGFGFVVDAANANRWAHAHGGLLSARVDMVVIAACRAQAGPDERFSTTSIHTLYMAPVPIGSFVIARAQVMQRTRNMLFVTARLSVEGTDVLSAEAVIRSTCDAVPGNEE